VGRLHGSNYLAAQRVPLHFTSWYPSKGSEIGGRSCWTLPKLYVEVVHVGSILPMLVKAPISPMQSVRYADVSGTFNLLHTDLQLAK
jgi:hypothetical protein